ncbi:MAG: type I-U CRISPR-associated protein Csx17, partial [Acidobacteriota bacterium]
MRRVLILNGCRSQPLGSYLKALGVLRLVSEQADPESRGWWTDGTFCVESEFDVDDLLTFFLERYSPTPIVAPWNGGSGFYEKDRKDGIDAIAASADQRFGEYRETILGIRSWRELDALAAEKKSSKAGKKLKRGGKEDLVRACRNRLCDRAVDWLDAAVVLRTERDPVFPPILGTGGNEGRLDYTNTFMCRLAELVLRENPDSPPLLRSALTGELAAGLVQSPTGQYDPGRAGGFNQGPGIEHKDFPTNPWNFILAMEGAVAWAAGVGRRQGIGLPPHAVSPFTVQARAVGYGSAAGEDETAARAEIWMPIWTRPACFEEIRFLLREGRAEIGRRQVADGLQFAQAASALGVDRGIKAFVRFSLLKRRGDSYVALPAGQFPVQYLRETDLLQDLDPYLEALERGRSSARVEAARRNVERAVYDFLLHRGKSLFRAILEALGRLERLRTESVWAGRRLRPQWLLA